LNYNLTPSRFLAILDPILPIHLLLRIVIAYVQDEKDKAIHKQKGLQEFSIEVPNDPLLCPYFASDDILEKFPPTSFICPGMDPLLDENIALARKLDSLGVDVSFKTLKRLSHAFMIFINVSN
jgi:acetyl esterase/lipase